MPAIDDPRVLVGHNSADDAGILKIDDDFAVVTTVDLLAPIVNDPYEFGTIAATNCLSDIYAMGGDPLVCLNVVGWPTGMDPAILGEIMQGSAAAVQAAGAVTLGGHTFQSAEIRYGLAVTGRIHPAHIFSNTTARPGDAIILTKPLGTGTIIQCAISRGSAPEAAYQATLDSMKQSNGLAAGVMREVGATACTDVTGFGFLGHAWELASGSGVGLEIRHDALPTFPAALDLIREGIIDGSHKMNQNSFQEGIQLEFDDPAYKTLLYSSESSGGLLITVEPDATETLLSRLRDAGMPRAAAIGRVVAEHPGVLTVR